MNLGLIIAVPIALLTFALLAYAVEQFVTGFRQRARLLDELERTCGIHTAMRAAAEHWSNDRINEKLMPYRLGSVTTGSPEPRWMP